MSTTEADLLPDPGTIIAGKYQVVRALGRGGMGIVLEARHLRLNQSVALKLLLPAMRSVAEVTARFEREARAAARLTGPHVARILDVEQLDDGSPVMVMEFLRGHELGDELAKRGPLPYREAVGYLLEACAAMDEAHRAGIVHRDIKPGNLFLSIQGDKRVIKVLDFGISKVTEEGDNSMTATSVTFGTPLYMSPEQVRSVRGVDGRTDVWSLGVVLYELLAGESPFLYPSATAILAAIIADTPVHLAERRPDIPRSLADVVMKALEKSVDARYQDVRAFAAALASFGPPGAADWAGPAAPLPQESAESGERRGSYTAAAMTAVEAPRKRNPLILAAVVGASIGLLATIVAVLAAPKPAKPSVDVTGETRAAVPSVTVAPAPSVAPAPTQNVEPAPTPTVEPVMTAKAVAPRPTATPTIPAPPTTSTSRATASPAPSAPAKAPSPAPTDDPKYL